MTLLYKIISTLVNIAALFIGIVILLSIPVLFSSTVNLLSGFMLVCIVLYAWFAAKFQRLVLLGQQVVPKSLRDWIRVNGIVSLIYSAIIIVGMTVFIPQPEILVDQMKLMGVTVPVSSIMAMLVALLVLGILLFVHILWTFALMKKNISYFE